MNRTETTEALKEKFQTWADELEELQEEFDNLYDTDEDWSDTDDENGEVLHDLHMGLENMRLTLDELEQSDEEGFEEILAALESEMEEFEESMSQARDLVKAA
ncbi:MAG: hypothetical protein WC777_03770 [Candidatus Gracilibacteria bacterium]|jgi:hypothetical protein